MLSLIHRSQSFKSRIAIIADGQEYNYGQLQESSARMAHLLLQGQSDLNEARVAFMVRPGFDYVKTLFGIWRAGGIAVPLSLHSPVPALEHILNDAQCSYLVAGEEYTSLLSPFVGSGRFAFFTTSQGSERPQELPTIDVERRALIIYTSGTTGKPKGVVTTHAIIESQIKTLVEAWAWTSNDHILNVLPLHHVHGLVNVLLCALWSGACCEFASFDARTVMDRLCAGEINLFMAVPTIYYKLIDRWQELSPPQQSHVHSALKRFRLMVSGSAALPVSVMEKWQEISGQILLERYGMTEIGMAISNPYEGQRKSGYIGQALPGVEVLLADQAGRAVSAGESGEIMVKGPNVFKEYWAQPETTSASFTKDGWFKTGDVAVFQEGSYRIMGRRSVDIIKSGGYKISALEIEEELRSHPALADCAVVGLPDAEWDEIVAAGLVWHPGKEIAAEALKEWLKARLPGYQVPRRFLNLESLPRNAMGKVTKPALKKLF